MIILRSQKTGKSCLFLQILILDFNAFFCIIRSIGIHILTLRMQGFIVAVAVEVVCFYMV